MVFGMIRRERLHSSFIPRPPLHLLYPSIISHNHTISLSANQQLHKQRRPCKVQVCRAQGAAPDWVGGQRRRRGRRAFVRARGTFCHTLLSSSASLASPRAASRGSPRVLRPRGTPVAHPAPAPPPSHRHHTAISHSAPSRGQLTLTHHPHQRTQPSSSPPTHMSASTHARTQTGC